MKTRIWLLALLLPGVLPGHALAQTARAAAQDPLDFIPEGHVLFEKIEGDLNRDGQADTVLIIKGTDPGKRLVDEYRGALDRNRRGLIIAFKQGDHYALALENLACFSSEQEDGGVYFAPELWLSIDKGILHIHYGHGRYGDWSYKFRYQDAGFTLIGYDDSDNRGPLIERMTSINFSTRKVLIRENINRDAQGNGDEVFRETWQGFTLPAPLRLDAIADFDGFYHDKLYPLIQ
ncbi:hypothetical protein [Aeromonas bivalvium]|uniref:hypothetical protein n=1 Tax=Aeromonas bivalvium TaxID=440079 RepID=UPI003D24E24E